MAADERGPPSSHGLQCGTARRSFLASSHSCSRHSPKTTPRLSAYANGVVGCHHSKSSTTSWPPEKAIAMPGIGAAADEDEAGSDASAAGAAPSVSGPW